MKRSALRVIGGVWKSRRLSIVPGSRPTSARGREAIFDILGEWIAGKRVLELYAGSGAIAIEALSRGASTATAVDRASQALEENRLALGAPVEVVHGSAAAAVRRFVREGRRFDLVFVDPPYDDADPVPVADLTPILASPGRIVWQSDPSGAPRGTPDVRVARSARYGRNLFTFLERP